MVMPIMLTDRTVSTTKFMRIFMWLDYFWEQ